MHQSYRNSKQLLQNASKSQNQLQFDMNTIQYFTLNLDHETYFLDQKNHIKSVQKIPNLIIKFRFYKNEVFYLQPRYTPYHPTIIF